MVSLGMTPTHKFAKNCVSLAHLISGVFFLVVFEMVEVPLILLANLEWWLGWSSGDLGGQ